MEATRTIDHYEIVLLLIDFELFVTIQDTLTNDYFRKTIVCSHTKDSIKWYCDFQTSKIEIETYDIENTHKINVYVNHCCLLFNKITTKLSTQSIVDTVKSFKEAEDDYLKIQLKKDLEKTETSDITYTIKSLDESLNELRIARESIDSIVEGLKLYPKAFNALSESFWKQYFLDHQIKWNPTSLAKDLRYEFRIQNGLKFFNQLSLPENCHSCKKHIACPGGNNCLNCMSSYAKNELCADNIEIVSFLSLLSSDTIIQVFTSCGTIPITKEVFELCHTIQGEGSLLLSKYAITFFQQKRLFYIKFVDEQAMYQFLCQCYGTIIF